LGAQGFASGDLDADAAGARALASVPGVEMITVQSYSKNMGLYAERAGVVSFTCVTLSGCPRRDLRPAAAQALAPLVDPPTPQSRA
jgi:aspartate/tyrosine/aromatic aminotransferase